MKRTLVNLKNALLLTLGFGTAVATTSCCDKCCNGCGGYKVIPVENVTNTQNIYVDGDNNIVGGRDVYVVGGNQEVKPDPEPNPDPKPKPKPKPDPKPDPKDPVVDPQDDCDCEEIVTTITREHTIKSYGERVSR